MTKNEKLIAKFKAGNTAPLLKALKDAPTSAGTDPANGNYDGGVSDTLYFEVMAQDFSSAQWKLIDGVLDRA